MGGVSTIKAAAAMEPGTVKALVLNSPSTKNCAIFYNYSQKEIEEDWRKARNNTADAPWFLYTSTNDLMQSATLKLYDTALAGSTIYAQYKTAYCKEKPPLLNTTIWENVWLSNLPPGARGHFCAGLLTLTAWTTTFLKSTLQHANGTSSCTNISASMRFSKHRMPIRSKIA